MIRKAMIMAAGVGSRLGELSNVMPKPLVPVGNIPVTDALMRHMSAFGIEKFIANTYFKAEIIKEYFKDNKNIEFITEKELSGTAGGLRKCAHFFEGEEDFLVLSGDGLTDIDITDVYSSHKNSGAIATIVIKEVEKSEIHKYGIVVPSKDGFVDSFQEKPSVEEAKSNRANTGIYVFNTKIFDFIPENTFYDFAKNVFPSLMKAGLKINTCEHKGYWSDIGTIEQYKKSNLDVINGKVKSIPVENPGESIFGADIQTGENFEAKNSVIGNGFKAGNNCSVINSVIWDGVTLEDGTTVNNSIILSGGSAEGVIDNAIISRTGDFAVI